MEREREREVEREVKGGKSEGRIWHGMAWPER
jgi:hypothetical protein